MSSDRQSGDRSRGPRTPPARLAIGRRVALLRGREICPGGFVRLQPGDLGTVVGLSETKCAADFFGVTVVVRRDDVQPV